MLVNSPFPFLILEKMRFKNGLKLREESRRFPA